MLFFASAFNNVIPFFFSSAKIISRLIDTLFFFLRNATHHRRTCAVSASAKFRPEIEKIPVSAALSCLKNLQYTPKTCYRELLFSTGSPTFFSPLFTFFQQLIRLRMAKLCHWKLFSRMILLISIGFSFLITWTLT